MPPRTRDQVFAYRETLIRGAAIFLRGEVTRPALLQQLEALVAGAAAAGGVFTAVLFALGRFALAWYLGREAEASAYGAATSLVLLLIWVYYSAQILWRRGFSQMWLPPWTSASCSAPW